MFTRIIKPALSTAVLALLAFGAAPARAMDKGAFDGLDAQVKKEGFGDTKVEILKAAASANTFSCAQVAKLLGDFGFGEEQLQALEVLKSRIEDPANKATIVAVFSFDEDKEKAGELLASISAAAAAPARGSAAAAPRGASGGSRSCWPYQPTSGEAKPLQVDQVGAWPAADFTALVQSIQKESFTENRMNVLSTAIGSRPEGFTSAQVQQLVPLLTFSADMVKAMELMNDHLLGMTSREVLGVLAKYSFSEDKLKVLGVLKDVITDAENKFVILEGFSFSADKEAARKLLDSVRPRSPVYGVINSKRVIFVVDVSGSMEATFRTNRGENLNRLQFVQCELQTVLTERLPEGTKFNLIIFSSGVTPWKSGLVAATPQAVQEAAQYVAGLRQGGGTNIYGALEKSFADPEADTVYFLTDGMPSEGKKTANADILKDVAAWSAKRKLAINTIAFLMGNHSSDNKPKSRAFMLDLAKATGGVYRNVE